MNHAGPGPHRLVRRLAAEHDVHVPDGWSFYRTYAGWHQRAAGAWSWWIEAAGREVVAAFVPVGELLATPAWTVAPDRFERGDRVFIIDPA